MLRGEIPERSIPRHVNSDDKAVLAQLALYCFTSPFQIFSRSRY
jgi:hypothetical protein